MFKFKIERHVNPAEGSGFPAEPVLAALAAHGGVQKVPSPKLDLFIVKRFLEPDLCARICTLIDIDRQPSTLSDHNGDNSFRTSETCYLADADPDVTEIDRRIAALTGLDMRHGEPMQGQRYAVGQEFKAHTDYFEQEGKDFDTYTSISGQRTWTVMIYLNEPMAGGATRFQGDRQDRSAGGRQIAGVEQPARRRAGEPVDDPPRHEGPQRHQIRHHQMVQGTPLAGVT